MNFVFDLGGVIVDWNPDRILSPFPLGEAERKAVRQALFGHPSWIDFDRGTVSVDEVVRGAAARSGVDVSLIEQIVVSVPESLLPFERMVELVLRIDRRRHRTFCLSNMSAPSAEHLESLLPMERMFDGRVISCRIGAAKPDPEIYRALLDRHRLVPAETVFYDDVESNAAAARRHGIDGRVFTGFAACARELASLGAFDE